MYGYLSNPLPPPPPALELGIPDGPVWRLTKGLVQLGVGITYRVSYFALNGQARQKKTNTIHNVSFHSSTSYLHKTMVYI